MAAAVGAVVAAGLVMGGLALVGRGSASDLDRARALAGASGRFESGREAGDTLAEISALVERAARSCQDAGSPRSDGPARSEAGDAGSPRLGDDDPGCQPLFAFAAWARVAAAGALRCTAPGRAQLRRATARHLDALATLAPDPPASGSEMAAPPLPRLPDCASLGRPPASPPPPRPAFPPSPQVLS